MLDSEHCIIRRERNEFVAYPESGREAFSAIQYRTLETFMQEIGYEVVPLNSRCGRTILDTLERKRII